LEKEAKIEKQKKRHHKTIRLNDEDLKIIKKQEREIESLRDQLKIRDEMYIPYLTDMNQAHTEYARSLSAIFQRRRAAVSEDEAEA